MMWCEHCGYRKAMRWAWVCEKCFAEFIGDSMKTPKRIWAREIARKEADYWDSTNKLQRERGESEYTLEWMFTSLWLKGFEAGRRDAAQRKKAGSDV